MDRTALKAREERLVATARAFSTEHLDKEWADLCERLVRKMGRKREVPFARGEEAIWAATVVCALGEINYLFDKGGRIHVSRDQLADHFGARKETVSSKSKNLIRLMDMRRFGKEFSVSSIHDSPEASMALIQAQFQQIGRNWGKRR